MSARLLIEQAEELDRATTRDWCDDFDMVGTRDKINGNVVCVAPGEELGGSRALWPNNKRAIIGARELLPQLTAELRRLQQLAEWRPISEAPKDGTAVLAWVPPFGCAVLRYLSSYDGWVLASHPTGTYAPTHYRPLPTGPA